MDDLFVHTLRDIYYAEKQIVKALPEMIEKATDRQLNRASRPSRQTQNHVERFEQVFKMHGVEPKGVDCPAIDGIIEEAEEISGEIEDKEVLDAALSPQRRRSSITRSPATARWWPGRSSWARRLRRRFAETSRRKKRPIRS